MLGCVHIDRLPASGVPSFGEQMVFLLSRGLASIATYTYVLHPVFPVDSLAFCCSSSLRTSMCTAVSFTLPYILNVQPCARNWQQIMKSFISMSRSMNAQSTKLVSRTFLCYLSTRRDSDLSLIASRLTDSTIYYTSSHGFNLAE